MTGMAADFFMMDSVASFGYFVLCVLFIVLVQYKRRQALGPEDSPADPRPNLGPYKLAIISGGPQLAITSAAAKLHDDGALVPGPSPRTLFAVGKPDPRADPLEREIHGTVERQPGIHVTAMRGQVALGEAIKQLMTELTQAGLLVSEEAVQRLRRVAILGVALLVIGIAGIVLSIDGMSIGPFSLILLLIVAGVTYSVFTRPRETRRARQFVLGERAERPTLRTSPSRADWPLAVALFGGAALWACDPAAASALGCPVEGQSSAAAGGGCGGGGGWGGDSGGGGGGGGGGGCGGGGGGCGGGGGGGS